MHRIFLALLIGVAFSSPATQDKVEVDNAWVRVLRITQATLAEFPSVVVDLNTGKVAYFKAGKSVGENTSGKPFEAIVIEVKPDAPKSPPLALDPVKLDPKHHTVPFENAQVRVLRTILEPHLKGPMHEHMHYVVVYLSDLHTNQTLSNGTIADNLRKRGEVGWREAVKHQAENVGDKRAEEIQIEIK